MPTNPNAPFGFQYIGKRDGDMPNFGVRTGLIASANTHATFTGDVLKPDSGGYLDVFQAAVGGGAPIGGVAAWFKWFSRSQNKTVRQNYWPGNGDAIGDVTCYYHADPDAVFMVQALLGPILQTDVGSNGNFDVGAGGQTVGAGNQSSFSLTAIGSGASLPFKIYNLPVKGPMAPFLSTPGFDATQPYNRVFVTINNLTA